MKKTLFYVSLFLSTLHSFGQCTNVFTPSPDLVSQGFQNGITVNSFGDDPTLLQATDLNCDGSLRWALLKAKQNVGGTYIKFSEAGIILLKSELPDIISSVFLDATTVPNYFDTPLVTIQGLVKGGYFMSYCFRTQNPISHTVIRGFEIENFKNPILGNNCRNDIYRNYFGKAVDIAILIYFEEPSPTGNRMSNIYSNRFMCDFNDQVDDRYIHIFADESLLDRNYQVKIGGAGVENYFYGIGQIWNGFETEQAVTGVEFLENKFIDIGRQLLTYKLRVRDSQADKGPIITGTTANSIYGTSSPSQIIEVYYASNNNKDYSFLGSVDTDDKGNWVLSKDKNQLPIKLKSPDIYYALSKDINRKYSPFSNPYVANILTADPVCAGTATILTSSLDPEITSYQWDFDNDGKFDIVTNEPTIKHIYPAGVKPSAKVSYLFNNGYYNNSNTIFPVIFSQPTIRATVTNQVCPIGNSANTLGSVTLFSNNGTAPYQYFLGTNSPSGESVYGSLSPGSFVANVVDSNQCKASTDFEVLDQTPKLKNICAEYAACDDGGVTRVKFTIERMSPPGNCSFPYTITNEGGLTFSGTALFNEETTVELTNAPAGAFKINLIQDNCNLCSNLSFPFSLGRLSAELSVTDKNKSALGNNTFAVCGDVVGLTFLFTQTGLPCDVSRVSLEKKTYKLEGNAYVLVSTETTTKLEESLSFGVGKYKVETFALPSKCKIADLEFSVVPNTFEVNVIVRQPLCYNDNGSASLEVSGGTAPYTYRWENPRTVLAIVGPEAKNVMPGGTKVTVTDAKGCIITKSFVLSAVPQMDKPKVEAVSPCYGKASINDMSFRSPYTFTWKRRFNQTTEVSDVEYFKLHQNEPIRKTKVTNVVMQNVFQQSVSVPEGTTYVSTPNQKLPFGDYFVEVSDRNGCKVTSDEYQVKKPDFTREYHVFVTIEDKPTLIGDPLEPTETNGPKLAALEMREAIESKVEECVTKKVGEISAKYAQSCRNIDLLDDYVAMSYNMQMQHSTLYYHDMAGNLVKTVPPEGVNKLKVKPANRNTHPNYTLATTYEYNSLGQKISETTPDVGTTKYLYNDKGQLRFSQNIKQLIDGEFSYVKYDDLGRIIEAGLAKLEPPQSEDGMPPAFPESDLSSLKSAKYINANSNGQMYPLTGALERTVTVYDTLDNTIVYPQGKGQEFLRNRVSQAVAHNRNGSIIKTWYSYDAHGNVRWLAQKTDDLPTNYIGYEYDLISNKVTKVKYNEQFFHRYSYDEDNRLVSAETSVGGYIWDNDATYTYYPHGPLRRTEVGEDRLQGVDYTYTINGWLKAINSPNLLATEDPWTDGYAQSEVAADEFSEVIGYHENDFTRTGPLLANAGNKYYLPTTRNLYNGNISTLTSKIGSSTDGSYPNTLTGNAYTYDRLNRITGSDFKVFNTTAGNFGSTDNFHEDFKYDGNGNITKVTRNGFSTAVPNNSNAQMDKLVYDYYPNTNKLKRINETTTSPLNSKLQDLTQQVDENYVYDEAGYLKFDKAENLEFKWTYNGKISEMIPISSTGKYKPHVKYAYDAQGNRVKKEVNEAPFSATGVRQTLPGKIKTTSYARDAQGNIMAVYEIEKTPSSIGEVHTYKLKELPIYGSDRIGIYKPEALIDYFTYSATQKQVFANRPFGSSNERTVGKKEYELKDHLGNVRVVFSDLRSESSPGGKETDVRSYYNYYAFGAIQPGRNSSTRDYRFNFNGKEMDYEIGWQDYGMRIYRPDIGRFGSVDPITSQYPELTPYQFASNRPIDAIDIDGLESGPVNGVNSQAYGEAFRNFGKGINTWGSNPGDPGLAHSLENATGLPRGSLKTNYDVLRGYMTMLGQRGAGGNPWKSGGPWGAQRNLITKPKIGATTIKVSNLRINVGGEGEMTGLIDVNPLVGNLRDEAAIRQRNPTGDFIKAGAEKLPFPDESVIDYSSIGLNKNAFEFPEQVASEAIRVLAPGGKAIINSNSFIFMNARVRKSFEDRGFKITPNGQSAIITKPHKTN